MPLTVLVIDTRNVAVLDCVSGANGRVQAHPRSPDKKSSPTFGHLDPVVSGHAILELAKPFPGFAREAASLSPGHHGQRVLNDGVEQGVV